MRSIDLRARADDPAPLRVIAEEEDPPVSVPIDPDPKILKEKLPGELLGGNFETASLDRDFEAARIRPVIPALCQKQVVPLLGLVASSDARSKRYAPLESVTDLLVGSEERQDPILAPFAELVRSENLDRLDESDAVSAVLRPGVHRSKERRRSRAIMRSSILRSFGAWLFGSSLSPSELSRTNRSPT
jgi:hypothetical protein